MSLENFYQHKRVAVLGGAGFIGSNTIEKLLTLGAHVRATTHIKEPQIHDSRIEYVRADLMSKKDIAQAMNGIDYVFMCAANTSGAGVIEKTPLAHVTPNVIMNALALEAAYEVGVKKFLWLSSNTVYPALDRPVREEDAFAGEPFEKYFCVAWMKRFSEILCEMYAKHIPNPMKVVVVRPANLYGEYDDFEWETSHVVPALIRKVVERHDPIEVWGDGRDIKDLMYIKDFVEGMLLAMERIDDFQPLNIGTGVPVTVRDALAAALRAEGYESAKISFNAAKPTMIPKRLIDVSRAENILGFKARTPLAEGIAHTVAWYREKSAVKK
ncbi:MAG: NAD-dependent epimerase/dehydratase family protein [bacterium]|nr:NAD-dependent epimerase/dehydratase family protein [bacterium]